MRLPRGPWRRTPSALAVLGAVTALCACGPAPTGDSVGPPAAVTGSGPGSARPVGSPRAALGCAGLLAAGWPYASVVDFWQLHDEAGPLDADGNGMPCESEYADADVSGYWHHRRPQGLPNYLPGLSCAQLLAWSFSYPQAVAYWYVEGTPARLDVDGNAMPCETVYPAADVDRYWY